MLRAALCRARRPARPGPVILLAAGDGRHFSTAALHTQVDRLRAQLDLVHFTNLTEFEQEARRLLPKMVYGYYASGSETESSLYNNLHAMRKYKLMPRMMAETHRLNTTRKLFGLDMDMPVFVPPMAMQKMGHPDGEVAMMKAALHFNVPYVASCMATTSMQEMAATGTRHLWWQLYPFRDKSVVRDMVTEAEELGYRAIVLTVDAPKIGKREADEKNRFRLPPGLQVWNLERLQNAHFKSSAGSGMHSVAELVHGTPKWSLIPWLQSICKLPILVKGLLCQEDAALALDHGVDGIIVSNHGGRQLDFAPAPIDVLEGIVRRVDGRVPVLVDGGFTRGTDVIKALAFGATAVGIGRPLLFALAVGGQAGVQRALHIMRSELTTNMALLGCSSLSDINRRTVIAPGDPYW